MWHQFALWGFAGGVIVDGLEFLNLVKTRNGKLPFYFKTVGYWVGELIRLASGAMLAVAFGQAGQVTVPLGALTVGVAAPLLVKRLSQQLPRLPEE